MMDYSKHLNPIAKSLKPSGIRKFFDIVAERKDAISLGVGEPDFGTPWNISDKAIKSVKAGYTHYTSNAGLMQLREEISTYYSTRYGVKYDPKSEILVTVGASEGIDLAMRALVSEGDEVLVASPSYVSYAPCISLNGGVAVPVRCYEKDNFKLTKENLEQAITPRSKVLILPYPNNPTGAIMTREDLEDIVPIIIKHDLIVVSDEIYSELTYNGREHCSIASIEGMWERTITLNGFSKAFAMTGWRLGYFMAPKGIVDVVYKIHQYAIMCAPTMSQFAGLEALTSGLADGFSEVEKMKAQYDKRRKYLVRELNDMGLHCFEPEGAFYVFPCVESTGMTGEEFAERLLESQNVAVVPGSAFGDEGRYFVRISYAYSIKDIDVALSRIREFLKQIDK